jgi:hypothetical protein
MNGEFIHIDCDIFPITSFMYINRKVIKTETVLDLKSYVLDMIEKLDVKKLNVEFFEKYSEKVIELAINEHGIVRISLKGETNETETSTK